MEKLVEFFNKKSHQQYRPLLCNNDNAITPAHRGSSSIKKFRDAPPTHYTYKIGDFSSISNCLCHRSPVFEEGGFNWKLCFYPNGKKQYGGEGYISLYLMIADTDSLNPGWEVKAFFRLFLFDQLNGKYKMLGDSQERTFHAMHKEQGFARFIPIKKFKKLYRYLINDACVIGAEVFVIKSTGKGDCFSRIRGTNTYKTTWMMKRFSKLENKDYYSKPFTVGRYEWRNKLNPRKIDKSKSKEYNISLHLELVDSAGTLFPGQQLYVDFTLCMKDADQNISFTYRAQSWFGGSRKSSGCQKFISLDQHNDPEQDYTVGDIYIIESQVTVLGLASTLP